MKDLTFEPQINIDDLSEQDAIALFGRSLYEAWKATKGDPNSGSARVVGVDRKTGTVTISYEVEP